MRLGVKRLELVRIRVCSRCGRGGAELRAAAGEERLVVPLDPIRARQLSGAPIAEDVRSLTDLLVERLAVGARPSEVVLDVTEGRLCGFLSLLAEGDAEGEVVACTAEEAVALAVRGAVALYATDEALARGTTASPERRGGAGGPDTVH
jgi:hypothetical protein